MKNNLFNTLLTNANNHLQIEAGENIYNFGEKANRIYFILKGLVRLFIKTKDGQEKEIARLKSGDILGELALLETSAHSSRAMAHKDTNLLEFLPQKFNKIMKNHTAFAEKTIINLCQRIDVLQKPVVELPEIPDSAEPDKKEESSEKDNKNKVDKETGNKKKAVNSPQTTDLYLEGHQRYEEIAAESFDHYLYTKTITCPVCSAEIDVKKVRHSRLRLKEIREDLRPFYKDFKPHWYKVWICPECYYTARKDDFFEFNKKQKNIIGEKFKDIVWGIMGRDYKPGYSEPRTLNEVFDGYYLALKLYNLIEAGKDKFAYLWLRLSWLYEDLEEKELADKTSYKAMENFRDYYFNDDTRLDPGEKDKLALLISNLFNRHGFEDKAIFLLNKLISSSRTKPGHKKRARDLYMDIRAEQRNNE